MFIAATAWVIFLIGKDMLQKKHTLRRIYPLVGRFRWLAEDLRNKMIQYFIESNTNGKPFSREQRSLVYQLSKKGDDYYSKKDQVDTLAFGTQHDYYEQGHEIILHSNFPKKHSYDRIDVGEKYVYNASRINSSAMSFGSLSPTAIKSINIGAKKANFAQNTGEGGISKYHLEGGDLIWQIGTGYFGARDEDGNFSMEKFKENLHENVKMIEIKLSQGAKPGHGGILPASKNTEEIAEIRGVKPNEKIISPPYHTAFSNWKEMLSFIDELREVSKRPVGIKMCVGNLYEFEDLHRVINEFGISPDYIAIDGGEGGTGAAPLTFSNNVGFPLIDSLILANKYRKKYNLKHKLIVSGKIVTNFDIIKMHCLGADLIYMARPMLLSLGCIQATDCNKNTCPVGIATQDKKRWGKLDPKVKSNRIYFFHKNTIESVEEMLFAISKSVNDLNEEHILKRSDDKFVKYSTIIEKL